MRHLQTGAILITTLIIISIMTILMLQIFQCLILMEKTIDADWRYSSQMELLRKTAHQIINLPHWPLKCFKTSAKDKHECMYNGYYYTIEVKKPHNCSIMFSKGHWRDALLYHIWVWQDDLPAKYFCRIAKPALTLSCKTPLKPIRHRIVSESIQPVEFNIRHSTL